MSKKRSVIERLEGTTKEKYAAYLMVKSNMLKIKENDNTMSPIVYINDFLNSVFEGDSPIDDFDKLCEQIRAEMEQIGRRHGIEVITYEEFVKSERDNRLEDLGI